MYTALIITNVSVLLTVSRIISLYDTIIFISTIDSVKFGQIKSEF